MKKYKIFLLLIILTLTNGCYSYFNVSTSLFPISMGIDFQDGIFSIIYFIDDDLNENKNKIIKGSGTSLAEAESNLNASITKNINTSFLKSIILSKSLTDNTDFVGLLLYYLSDPKFVKSTYLYLSDENIIDLFKNGKNFYDISIYPSITTKEGTSIKTIIKPLTLINIASHYLDNLQRIYLPSLTLDDIDNYIYLDGTCFTSYTQEFALQCLSNQDNKGLRWMDQISGMIITPQGYETTLKGIVSDNIVTLNYKNNNLSINLNTSISLVTVYDDINPVEIKTKFEEIIKEEITITYKKALTLQVDIYNLKAFIKKEYSKDYDLPNELNVSVNVTINTKSHY